MLDNLQIAVGSVVGKDHIANGKCLIGRNNQDAFAVHRTSDFIVAFVCDGCGSGKHSEVGAWVAANALTQSMAIHYQDRPGPQNPSYHLQRIKQDLLAQIRLTANIFGGSFTQTITDYFLFTTVGLLITPEVTQVVAIGDGVYALSSKPIVGRRLHNLGPFPGNQPPYMAYDLVESNIDPSFLKFKVVATMRTSDFHAALIGSDGVEDLYGVADQKIPGTKEDVGLLPNHRLWDIWENDLFYSNPDALGRRLRRCNSEVKRINKETGRITTHNRLLPDDTTLISVRRPPINLSDTIDWRYP